MPDPIPTDDLYARLGVPADADTPAIDRAWRSLLKQHHPDIAGTVSLELAKLINVAHDWLADPARRARYDEALHRREGRRMFTTERGRATRSARRSTARPGTGRHRSEPPPSRPSDDLDEVFGASAPAVRSFFGQAAGLTASDVDRLSVSEAIDPVADLRDVIPPELWARIEALDARLSRICPPAVLADDRAAMAARAYGHAIVLELFLWYYLADPEPLLEQMRRGWESSVGLPRYGPNTDEVTMVLDRLAVLPPVEAARIAAAWQALSDAEPWPEDAWEFDFAALEVSAALARRDATRAGDAVARAAAVDQDASRRWSAAFASTAHVVTLRPIFPPRAYARFREVLPILRETAAARAAEEAPRPKVRRA